MIRLMRIFCFIAFALGNFLSDAYANASIPNHYQEAGLYPNRDYLNHHLGEFIDPFQGSLQLQHADIFLPGNGGFDLKVQRSYNLRTSNQQSPFGLGWDIHFGRVKKPNLGGCGLDAQTKLTVEMPDGSQQSFFRSAVAASGAGTFLTTRLWRGECSQGGMIVYSPDGTRYDMFDVADQSFNVTKITDRNGNYATFTYGYVGPVKVIKSVTASDGRSITFTYSGTTSGVLTGITANGRTWGYTVNNVEPLGASYRLAAVTPPTGNGWAYTYYGDRQQLAGTYSMKSVTYPQGGTISYDYGYVIFLPGVVGVDRTTVVTSKTTSDGNWSFSYQPGAGSGQYDVTTVTLPNGIGQIYYKHFGYWTSGKAWTVGLLYQKTSGSAETETYSWESQIISNEPFARFGYAYIDNAVYRPLLASVNRNRDGGNFSTSYSNRDVLGNPQTISESGTKSRTTTKGYFNSSSTNVWIIGLTSSESVSGATGSTTRTIQNATGNVVSENRSGAITNFSYFSDGSLNTRTDPRGYVTTYSNYFRGVPQSETRPEGVSISRSVDTFGNVTQDSDGESSWGYGYDALNRVTSITFPRGSSTSVGWNASSTTQSITRGAYSGSKSFDGYGRKIAETKGGISFTTQVDALGRVKFQSLPGSNYGSAYSLDILGRPYSISRVEGVTSMGYGPGTVVVTNPRQFSTMYRYDRYGDPEGGFLSGISPPEGTDVALSKDTLGLLYSATQGSKVRSYSYDSRRYLSSITESETGTTTFAPDANGNPTSKTTGGLTVNYAYDGLNRLKTASYAGTAGTVSYGYNRRGQLTSLINPSASRAYAYDGNGNLQSDTLTVDANTFVSSYAWDAIDGLQSITYPQNRGSVTYTPNALGRPTRASPFASSVSHHPSGNPSSISFANGIGQNYSEDNAQRPSSIGGPVGFSYSYDGVGNVTQIAGQFDPRTFTYDGADRLKTFSGTNGSGSFDYSTIGNLTLLVQPGRTVGYTYDGNNRLISNTGGLSRTYSYDTLGNVTGDGINNYTFDQSSMLTCSNCGVPGKESKFWYDGKGWRVMEERGGNRKYLVYGLRGELLYEYGRFGKTWKKYAYVNGKHIATEEGADAPATTTTLAATPTTVQFGQQVTLTATVSPAIAGAVTFRSGVTELGTVTLVNGVATLNVTNLSPGVASITAGFSGSADYQPSVSSVISVTVNKKTATASITATPTSGPLGQKITVSTTVTGASPTGQVELRANGTTVTTQPLTNGAVTFTSASLAAGATSFSVNYLGDAQNTTAASSAVAVTISKALPAMTLQTSATSAPYGSLLTLTTRPTAVSGFPVTGTFSFKNGSAVLSTSSGSDFAQVGLNNLAVGNYSLTATYSGDTNYLPNVSSAVPVTITAAATSVNLSLPAGPYLSGQNFIFTATVSGVNPTGQMRLMLGDVQVGIAPVVNGVAQITARLFPGSRPVRAEYLGDANNAPSNSASSNIVVTISPEDLAGAICVILNDD
jgi:YD repeat-containing protein